MSNPHGMFPDLTAEQIMKRVEKFWDLDPPFPTPRPGWLYCPICDSDPNLRFMHVRQTGNERSRIAYRVDMSFKCTGCSYVWPHGIAITKDLYELYGDMRLGWREAKEVLDG